MSTSSLGKTSASGSGGWFRFGIGPAIIAAAAWVIFWNEGGAARTEARIAEGSRSVVSVSAEKIDPSQEGKLVHLVGRVTTTETLMDPLLRVTAPAIKLRRVVEMYQWQEVESRQDAPPTPDGRPAPPIITYQHTKIWQSDPINSTLFKVPAGHVNPPALLKGDGWDAQLVWLGAFELTLEQKNKLFASTPLPLTGDQAQVALQKGQGTLYRDENQLLIRPDLAEVAKSMNQLKFEPVKTAPPTPPDDVVRNPQIGDIRIKFVVANSSEITALGQQVGKQIRPYKTQAGGELSSFLSGRHSAEQLFQSAKAWSQRGTWFFRAAALVIIYAGVFITLGPFTYYAATIAWLRPVVASGMFYVRVGLTIAIAAVLVGAAWLYYRPMLAIALFVVSGQFLVGTLWLIWRFSRSQDR